MNINLIRTFILDLFSRLKKNKKLNHFRGKTKFNFNVLFE